MNIRIPKLSYKGYVRHLRKQSVHVQHLHAFVFAAVITGITAFLILYYDYGLFHDVYVKEEAIVVEEKRSVGETFSNFFGEAKRRFSIIGEGGFNLLEGKETYVNSSTSTP